MLHRLALAVFLFAAAAGAQTFQPGGPMVLRDAQGRLVGQLEDDNVLVIINGRPTQLIATHAKLTSAYVLYFDQPNCQGTALINQTSSSPVPIAAFAPDGTVRVATSFDVVTRNTASFYNDRPQTPNCTNLSVPSSGLPTETGPNLKAMFQPPFSAVEGNVTTPVALSNVPANSVIVLSVLLGLLAIAAILRLR